MPHRFPRHECIDRRTIRPLAFAKNTVEIVLAPGPDPARGIGRDVRRLRKIRWHAGNGTTGEMLTVAAGARSRKIIAEFDARCVLDARAMWRLLIDQPRFEHR